MPAIAVAWLRSKSLSGNDHNFLENGVSIIIRGPEKPVTRPDSVKPPESSIRMAFEVPFVTRPALQISRLKQVVMRDFSSAGNRWSDSDYFRVWLPQPLYMGNRYARNSWKSLVYRAKVRPRVPAYIRKAMHQKYGDPLR